MLVLTRREADSIQIGDDVEITVLEVKGRYVKIGISAPRELDVYRSEIYVKINHLTGNKAGSKSSSLNML